MSSAVGGREKAILAQTLAPLLVGLVGYANKVTVDLKNDLQVRGLIIAVDCFMNITMTDAIMSSPSGPISNLDFIFVQRRSIRSVIIPEILPIKKLLKDQVDIATGVKAREESRKRKEKKAQFLRKKEKQRMSGVQFP